MYMNLTLQVDVKACFEMLNQFGSRFVLSGLECNRYRICIDWKEKQEYEVFVAEKNKKQASFMHASKKYKKAEREKKILLVAE